MRMIALAQAWQDRGGTVAIVSLQMPEQLALRIEAEGITLYRVEDRRAQVGSTADCQSTAKLARQDNCKWVVLDGYSFSPEYQQGLRDHLLRVLALDDFGYCDAWSANAVLNQNAHATDLTYRATHSSFQQLLGLDYVLLRRELHRSQFKQQVDRDDSTKNLLVTLGGGDPDNVTTRVLRALSSIRADRLKVHVVVGSLNPHRDEIEQAAQKMAVETKLLSNLSDMSAEYLWADLVVSAAGSTCWEWLHFGLTGAVISIAENQLLVAESLHRRRLATNLGWHQKITDEEFEMALRSLVQAEPNPPPSNLIDGWGAARVASHLDDGVWVRLAEPNDCRLYFDWVNDPVARQNSFQSAPIAWNEHQHWFASRLKSSDAHLFVCMRGEEAVGQIRFDRLGIGWEIDFSVDKRRRGLGIGTKLLKLGVENMIRRESGPLFANIKLTNDRSASCFKRAGFAPNGSTDQLQRYISER